MGRIIRAGVLLATATMGIAVAEDPIASSMAEGNWADALKIARQRLESDQASASDLQAAVECLRRLNRIDEFDRLVESATDRFDGDAAMLIAGADAYARVSSYGYLVEGDFRRGNPRGPAEQVSVAESDRVRRLRLALAAYDAAGENDQLAAEACASLERALVQNRWARYAWRLQTKTDLAGDLPEPESRWGPAPQSDPPPASEGQGPLLYDTPTSWAEAENDGERFRWALTQQALRNPDQRSAAELRYANFLYDQFSVRTLRRLGWRPVETEEPSAEQAAMAVETLSEEETIARLASGVQRFELPKGHRFIEIYERHQQWSRLFDIFLDRNQRKRAIEAGQQWLDSTADPKRQEAIEQRLAQLSEPWARFESVTTQPAGEGARLRITHRNATSIQFTARRVDVEKLLEEVRKKLSEPIEGNPWRVRQVEQIGWRLLHVDEGRFVGKEVASWTTETGPPDENHDTQTAVASPLQEAGAYLVRATPIDSQGDKGAETNVVVWVADAVLVRKPTTTGAIYQMLDSRTGQPIADATIDLFGTRQVRGNEGRGRIETTRVAERTDADGIARFEITPEANKGRYTWLAAARSSEGKQAHLGFENIWSRTQSDRAPTSTKTFFVSDRPLYRPGDLVQFKAWIGQPDYEQAADGGDPTPSKYAHQEFRVDIHDARGEKIDSQRLTADLYGGVTGELPLGEGASLGVYRVSVVGFGGGSFRVEEYRKPEFEVVVDAPEKPTKLGEVFEATVRATYYAGTPVRGGRLKYKVVRTRRTDHWLPPGPWDWLYGVGYGWLAEDATWRPGWRSWGCQAPLPPWWPQPSGPPEVVAEGEATLDGEGAFQIKVDTTAALANQPDSDHRYQITAEVTDAGRRTIASSGQVLAARRPLQVTVWLGRGHYEVGDTVHANVAVRTPDGRPVAGAGELRLLKLAPESEQEAPQPGQGFAKPSESLVQNWELLTDAEGSARVRVKASEAGRYRLVYRSSAAKPAIEGGIVFTIQGPGFESSDFRYGALELTPDKSEYAPGDTVRLLVNTDRRDASVTLFLRPTGGVYRKPKVLQLDGKSTLFEIPIARRDMPNFFVEAHTVFDGEYHTVTKQIVVPPESKVLQVDAASSATTFLPGEEGKIRVRITDESGEPVVGQATVAVYDRSIEAIAGGPSGGDIRKQFWDWKRSHSPNTRHSLSRTEGAVTPPGVPSMRPLGVFGDVSRTPSLRNRGFGEGFGGGGEIAFGVPLAAAAPLALGDAFNFTDAVTNDRVARQEAAGGVEESPAAAVRKNFADTALWVGSVETDKNGLAELPIQFPESLTSWKVRVWAVSQGLRVGQGDSEVTTRKDLMVRLRAPRFLVQKDEVVVSALVQNESSKDLSVAVKLQVAGETLSDPSSPEQTVEIPAGGEALVDWRLRALGEGEAKLIATASVGGDSALSDGMQVTLPVLIHGAEIVESFSEVLGPDERIATFELIVPEERRAEATRLEVRYSPTLLGAMLDALPYLIEFPHGCTEQTLNRFLPAAIVRKTIDDLGVELAELKPGESEDGPPRRSPPVFDRAELDRITSAGVTRLMQMQLSDGGWGWFSGWGEHSSPHTTAVVVRGLVLARDAGVAVSEDVIRRGVDWLSRYRTEQIERLANVDDEGNRRDEDRPWKRHADNLDALVELTLTEAGVRDTDELLQRLFEDRLKLSPYSQAMVGLVLHDRAKQGVAGGLEYLALRDRVIQNLKQFVELDDENQTAWLNLPGGSWWYWYGSEYEAHAYFLKLLAATEPKGELAPRLVKYLLANRRQATRWNSTRDTALVVEAMADYVRTSGEAAAEGEVEIWLDGKRRETQVYDATTALQFEGVFSIAGDALSAGRHTLELRKKGEGRLYAGALLTNFSLEDDLRAAGLEVRVSRRVHRLEPIEATGEDVDARGGVLQPSVERYRRVHLPNLGEVRSGDLIEVELTIASKNDYEYILLEDPKPAGFEPVEQRSGYNGNAMGAYVEFRDQQVVFYARTLARGERTVKYRLRAETPGRYSALPTQIRAMYAPELRGNSDEFNIVVGDEAE